MYLRTYTFLCFLVSVSIAQTLKSTKVLQGNSIEDEVSFHLYHYTTVTRAQDLFIDNITSIIASGFDRNLPTKFIIHGWTHGQEAHWVKKMREVMANTKKWNVIVVDWAPISYTVYTEARGHSHLVGLQLGKMCIFLLKLQYIRLPLIHFIGHSMGAHIAGYASDTIKEKLNNQSVAVARITALDPIAYLFERPYMEPPEERLDKNDAHFVDVIHTNGRGFGMKTAIGHVDFYPNGGMVQPGCSSWMCSHERSCEFWIASIKHPCEYRAISYTSWNDYLSENTKNLTKVPMGIGAGAFIPRGLYFLETPHEEPYVKTNTTSLNFIK